jgi:sulfide dehydrogenase [flavocytochrome c] flavoprotein subunit
VPAKKVTKVDAKNMTVSIEGIEDFKADVINLIPAQRAANFMVKSDLVGEDKKWCPVNAVTFESTKHKDIHIIGDATALPSDGPPMPKSGYSANSQAKVCAQNVVNLMNGKPLVDFSGINVCYSAVSDHGSVSIAQVFALVNGKIKSSHTAISPADFSLLKAEHAYGESWLKNILTEMSS